jgi:hypothetical protein
MPATMPFRATALLIANCYLLIAASTQHFASRKPLRGKTLTRVKARDHILLIKDLLRLIQTLQESLFPNTASRDLPWRRF